MADGNDTKFQKAMSNGLVATAAWFALLFAYCLFQALRIEVPAINQAFPILTGGWVGMLTLAQGNKNKQIEEKADKAEEDVKQLKRVAKKAHPKTTKQLVVDDE